MALDLFANFERASNNSLFYRSVSSVPHDIVFKLVDGERSGLELIDTYQAEYSLDNSSQRLPLIDLQLCKQFDRSSPATHSITVYVSSLDPAEYTETITLSVKYVSNIPEADFIIYPTYVFDEQTGGVTTLNLANYYQSSGTYFYGEGHTEPVNLSANYSTAHWYVGNSLSAIENEQSIISVNDVTSRTAIVTLTSSPALEETYDVSLRVTTPDITLSGPILTYDDQDGTLSYYPFFASTIVFNGCCSYNPSNHTLRAPIEIKPYPQVENFAIVSQLSGYPPIKTSLPYDYSYQRFIATVEPIPLQSFLTESLYATQWKIETVADPLDTNPDWSNVTSLYPSVTAYSFPLAYYNKNNINDFLFRCSAGFDTTVTTTVSVYKTTIIDEYPNDWLCRTTVLPISEEQLIAGMPVGRIYTSNYYYLTGEDIKIHNITEDRSNITITSVVLSSENLDAPLVFEQSNSYKTVSFNEIGTVSFYATINFIDSAGQNQSITSVIENFIEIVSEYDSIDKELYRSSDSVPPMLLETYPRISPNEWVTEDNINSLLLKFNNALDQLRFYARKYNTTNTIIGRLEPTSIPEGSCLGEYCLDWRWSARECGNSTIYTTWENTECVGEYATTWEGESCDLINQIGCGRGPYWIVPSINPVEFEDWACINEEKTCEYVGIAKLVNKDTTILAYPTELHLLDSNFEATTLNKHFFADEVFEFVSIVAIAVTANDRIAVLDSKLSKVSVFSVDENNNLLLFSTWGRYGSATSKIGFNRPQDIHVDQHNSVWVCDTGNECIKKLTVTGRHILTIQNAIFEDNAPLNICVDSDDNLHCLAQDSKIYVFTSSGEFSFSYSLPDGISGIKINSSFNREMIYITYDRGVLKYFKNGLFSHYVVQNYPCSGLVAGPNSWTKNECSSSDSTNTWEELKCWDQLTLVSQDEDSTLIPTITPFTNIIQDKYRNVYVTINDVIVKITDRMTIDDLSYESYVKNNSWSLDSILIDKEEYIQPWVYLRSFHRLWDNIELFRNSLFYEVAGCKGFVNPVYSKEELKLGQNEIVTNATINRLSEQLWANLLSFEKYFNLNCKK